MSEIQDAIWLTLVLSLSTSFLLCMLTTPLAWWLAHTRSRWRPVIYTCVSLPLVLPPTVIGFYLLIAFNKNGILGKAIDILGLPSLAFSFSGLLIGSLVYSLPFVVQPLVNAFQSVPRRHLEAAATLRANKLDTFFTIELPLAWRGYLTAGILGFAHTVGEFGVVLMIGGNIPGKTRVLSIALYDMVEALQFSKAHLLAAGLLVFSFGILILLFTINRNRSETMF